MKKLLLSLLLCCSASVMVGMDVQPAPAGADAPKDLSDEYNNVVQKFAGTKKWTEDYVQKLGNSSTDRALRILVPQEIIMLECFIKQVAEIGVDSSKTVAKEQMMRQVVELCGEIVQMLQEARVAPMQPVCQKSDSEVTDTDDAGSFKSMSLDAFLSQVSDAQTKNRLDDDSEDSDDGSEGGDTCRFTSDSMPMTADAQKAYEESCQAHTQDIEHRKMLHAQRLTQCNIYYDTQYGYFVANQRKHIRKTLKDVIENLAEIGAQKSMALDESTAGNLLKVLNQFDVGLDEQAVTNLANLCPNENQKTTMRGRTYAGGRNDGQRTRKKIHSYFSRTKSEKTIANSDANAAKKSVKLSDLLALRKQDRPAAKSTANEGATEAGTALLGIEGRKQEQPLMPDHIDFPANPSKRRLSLREKVMEAFVPGYFPSYGFGMKRVANIFGEIAGVIKNSTDELYSVQKSLSKLAIYKSLGSGLFAGFAAWRFLPRGNGVRGLVAAGVCGIASYLWNKRSANKTYTILERGLVDEPETSYLNQTGSALHVYCEPLKETRPNVRDEILSSVEDSIRTGSDKQGIKQRLGILNRLRGYNITPR